MIGLVNITNLLQNNILIEFSDNLVYNTFNLNKRSDFMGDCKDFCHNKYQIATIFLLTVFAFGFAFAQVSADEENLKHPIKLHVL